MSFSKEIPARFRITLFASLTGVLLVGVAVPASASAMPWEVSRFGKATITDVQCPTESFCAASAGNKVLITTNPIGGGSAWKVAAEATPGTELWSVSCPKASACVAVGYNGEYPYLRSEVVTSNNPTGGPKAWTVQPFDEYYLVTTFCPSTALCIIAGSNWELNREALLTSTNPTDTPPDWMETSSFPEDVGIEGIGCSSEFFCVMGGVDGAVLTSTDPAGEDKWTLDQLPEGSDPEEFPASVLAVSCPDKSLCIAPGIASFYSSTEPLSGAWTRTLLGYSWYLGESWYLEGRDASCPSVSMCVVVSDTPFGEEFSAAGSYGAISNVSVSTNPAGGESAWFMTAVDATDNPEIAAEHAETVEEYPTEEYRRGLNFYLESVSCPSAAWCVAVGGRGVIVIGTPTTNPPNKATNPPTGGEENQAGVKPPPSAGVRCVVPKLKGKLLGRALKLVNRHHCGLGNIRESKKAHHHPKRVIRQRPKAGTILPIGGRVSMVVG